MVRPAWDGQIPAIDERCAGIDIGKRELAVTVIAGPADQEGEVKRRLVGTTVPELEELKQWLLEEGCTSVAMESTGSYWIPVKNVLEDSFEIVLVCPHKHHSKRGDKSDFRDADLLAQYQRHGLLRGSFLAPQTVVELRDLTRRRKELISNLAAEKNRIQKVLEAANVKLGNIVSDVFGVSGQAMLEALLSGRELPPEEIADLAKRRLRQRIPELAEALKRHRMTDHHRWLINQSIEHIVLLDRQLEELETAIQKRIKAWPEQKCAAADHSRHQGNERRHHPGRDRPRHRPVLRTREPVQMGRHLPGQQPLGGQEQARAHPKGQQIPDHRASGVGLGGDTHPRLAVPAPIPALDAQPRQTQSQRRPGPQPAAADLGRAPVQATLPPT